MAGVPPEDSQHRGHHDQSDDPSQAEETDPQDHKHPQQQQHRHREGDPPGPLSGTRRPDDHNDSRCGSDDCQQCGWHGSKTRRGYATGGASAQANPATTARNKPTGVNATATHAASVSFGCSALEPGVPTGGRWPDSAARFRPQRRQLMEQAWNSAAARIQPVNFLRWPERRRMGHQVLSVKPSAQPSMVRIHHLPPPRETAPDLRESGRGLRFSGSGCVRLDPGAGGWSWLRIGLVAGAVSPAIQRQVPPVMGWRRASACRSAAGRAEALGCGVPDRFRRPATGQPGRLRRHRS